MFAPHGVLSVFSIFDNVIIWGEGVSGDGGDKGRSSSNQIPPPPLHE